MTASTADFLSPSEFWSSFLLDLLIWELTCLLFFQCGQPGLVVVLTMLQFPATLVVCLAMLLREGSLWSWGLVGTFSFSQSAWSSHVPIKLNGLTFVQFL